MTDTQRQYQLQLPSPSQIFTPVVTTLLVLMIIGYALTCYAPGFIVPSCALSRAGLLSGKVWQLITYPFVNGCIITLLCHASILLFIGSTIERQWRSRAFLILWVFLSIICGFLWLLVNLVWGPDNPGYDTSGCIFGLVGAFGILFRDSRYFLFTGVVKAQVIVWLLIGVGFVVRIPRPICWVWLLGALVGYLYVKASWLLADTRNRKTDSGIRNDGFVDLD